MGLKKNIKTTGYELEQFIQTLRQIIKIRPTTNLLQLE
jgi:hypothetical protein